jgi:hypothetical protein
LLDVGLLEIDRILFYQVAETAVFVGGEEPEFDFGPLSPAHRSQGVSLLYGTFSLKQGGRLF